MRFSHRELTCVPSPARPGSPALGTQVNSRWENRTYPPLPKNARPTQTFYTTGSLDFGGEHIDYGYLPQAHTDGDIYVFFRTANVLVAGDVVSVGAYPIIDYSTNGWIGGLAEGTKALLGLADAATRIVPGSGPVQTRAAVEAEHAMLATLKPRLSQLLAKGMSVEDMLAAAPEPGVRRAVGRSDAVHRQRLPRACEPGARTRRQHRLEDQLRAVGWAALAISWRSSAAVSGWAAALARPDAPPLLPMATSAGVRPWESLASRSAWCSASVLTRSSQPQLAAPCSAVWPLASA